MNKHALRSMLLLPPLVIGLALSAVAQEQQERPGTPAPPENQACEKSSKKQANDCPTESPIRANDAETIEEVLVIGEYIEGSGRRRGTAASRDDLDRSDVISMEDFFDNIQGLSTLGGDDEGNSFSIDGLSPDLSNVTLNGQGFGEGRANNGFGAGDLPPEMIRRVEVYRIPTAMQEEGGAAGSVNLQLRNPVEIARPTNSVKGRLSYVPERGTHSPSGTFFTGRPSPNRTFGYMLGLTVSERVRHDYSQDIKDWVLNDFDGRLAFYPGQVRNNAAMDDQRTVFAGVVVGFRPTPSLDLGASLLLNSKVRDVITHSLLHRFENQRSLDALAFQGRIVSQLDSSDPGRRNLRIVGSGREEQTNSLIFETTLGWRFADWRFNAALNYKVDDGEDAEPSRSGTFEANSDFGYQAASDGALVTHYANAFPAIGDFDAARVNLNERQTRDTSKVAALDINRPIALGLINRLRFGAKLRDMGRDRTSARARVDFEQGQTLAEFFSGRFWRSPWDTVNWPGSDLDAIDAFVRDTGVQWEENLLDDYEIERKTLAGYLQADFRTGEERRRFLVGNLGLRIVTTRSHIEGYRDEGERLVSAVFDDDYLDLLPSLNLRLRMADRTLLSLGAARVMTHPAFNDLAPGIRVNYSDKTGRAGNPELEPFQASVYMAEWVWVPVRGRRVTGHLSFRDVDRYFAMGEESLEIGDEDFLVTRPTNGDDGSLLTAMLKFEQNLGRLHARLQNLTLALSYTRNKSSTDARDPYTHEVLPLPNTAEQVAWINLGYARGEFNGKLSYQWRGRSLRAATSESNLSVWNEAVGSLNLNLAWLIDGGLQLSLDARNLLDEDQVRSTDDARQLWRLTERDRSIAATLRYKW
jgi:TonB-dependent receptor